MPESRAECGEGAREVFACGLFAAGEELVGREETRPVEEVAEGHGTMLVELFELLDRLIGNDLSVQLAEMSKRDGRTSLANSGPEGSSPQSRGPA